MTHSAMIRPAWTPATIALMVLGFMVFWPLGLAMLAYILWGDRLDAFKADVNRATDGFARSCRRGGKRGMHSQSGNVAFDEWRETELTRLDEERRKLDEMRREFDQHMRDLRMARDREEFDRFMARRDAAQRTGAAPASEIDG
ncbi:uncharacterized protein DUF2852 [Hoeflea marina]|uniref:Uncharacterized protein DUF2852 n=1 Tax=Hoeflea marina TaxID=274592 RepID=A0A317PJI2_9HYPH|nr:DUF2852 domain-containing protein [Hoeflea marina]PWW00503.1 uncharacterized protein DUF2852 [Hoeflea marina]